MFKKIQFESEEEEEEEDEDDDEEKRIEEDPVTCDAEAEIIADQVPAMLQQVSARTRAFFGDWSTLPEQLGVDQGKYDLIVTTETVYAEHSLPDLIRVIQKSLRKPDVMLVPRLFTLVLVEAFYLFVLC
ncbi:hypothetical protein RMATCC62417_11840 [Rhizopus microsporus]|nr:hypothetical protein RMATCC62417_11840 [Rhizopus microsporus]